MATNLPASTIDLTNWQEAADGKVRGNDPLGNYSGGSGGSAYPTWPDNVIAYEDFASGDLLNAPAGMSWDDDVNTAVVAGVGTEGSNGLVFTYKAESDPTNNQSPDAWAEQEFVLDSEYLELWVGWRLFIPDNYYHRDPSGPSNNKVLALYMDAYSSAGDGPTVFWNTWDDGAGGSVHTVAYSEGNFNVGGSHSPSVPLISVPADCGRSMQMVFRVVAASARGANDGIIQMYRRWDGDSDWEQIADIQNADIAPPPTGAIRGWKQAKVLGWSNAGFDEETLLVMDDFVISQNSLIV